MFPKFNQQLLSALTLSPSTYVCVCVEYSFCYLSERLGQGSKETHVRLAWLRRQFLSLSLIMQHLFRWSIEASVHENHHWEPRVLDILQDRDRRDLGKGHKFSLSFLSPRTCLTRGDAPGRAKQMLEIPTQNWVFSQATPKQRWNFSDIPDANLSVNLKID